MKIIYDSQVMKNSDFYVLDVDEVGVVIECKFQVEDLIYNSPQGQVLAAWDFPAEIKEFPTNQCMLFPFKDDLKEINNVKFTRIAFKSVSGTVKLYVCLQRN